MLPGFSGGPLVDASGAILGLNSSTLGRGGGGLTVPNAAIERTIASLQTHGRVRRGFLGVGAQAVRLPRGMAEGLQLPREQGLLIVSLEPEGPADKGGLLIGDIIVALAGQPVGEVEELQDRLTGDWVGRAMPIRIVRGGQVQDVEVTVGERG
jgi:serine protease DegQ